MDFLSRKFNSPVNWDVGVSVLVNGFRLFSIYPYYLAQNPLSVPSSS